jgi:hypothetical protein
MSVLRDCLLGVCTQLPSISGVGPQPQPDDAQCSGDDPQVTEDEFGRAYSRHGAKRIG